MIIIMIIGIRDHAAQCRYKSGGQMIRRSSTTPVGLNFCGNAQTKD